MKRTRNIAFIVELLLLFVILLLVIVVITRTFMAARGQSLYAKHLTEAVCLAEDAAEVDLAAKDAEEALALFAGMDQVESVSESGNTVTLVMDFTDEKGGSDRYQVELIRSEEQAGSGTFSASEIRVYPLGGNGTAAEEPLYTLNTGEYHSGGQE